MKPILSSRKMFSVLLAISVIVMSALIFSGCGTMNTKTNAEYASEYLESACQGYFDVDYEQALTDVNTSIAYASINEAWSLKAQLQYLMTDTSGAAITLAGYKASFPNDGCADLLQAYFTCLNGTGGGSQLLGDLQSALGKDYAGLGYEGFWGMVEEFEGFSYFRDNFPAEYASLEAMKTSAPVPAAGDGETKFVKHNNKIGPALYIKHSDMWMLNVVRDLEKLIAGVVIPKPYNWIVKEVIKQRTVMIKAKDKGRGVMLQWTVASWVPSITVMEAFYTYSQ
jgi:hypothetical protein